MFALIIDDDDGRHDVFERYLGEKHSVLHAFCFDEAISLLKSTNIRLGLVCFDNDLGEEKEGSDIASYILREMDLDKLPAQVIVHSHNHEAAANIASKTMSAGIPTSVRPFSKEMVQQLALELEPS